MKYISLFSGIGAFEKAFRNIDPNQEILFFSEIDRYAEQSYCLIHNISKEKNFGDITKITQEQIKIYSPDILTYGFPCQPFSLAGNKEGFKDHLGRGLMFFEALRIISLTKPKVAIAENVTNLKNFKQEFEYMLSCLSSLGYTNKIISVNSKDKGSPQNRERIFIISVLNKKAIRDNGENPQKRKNLSEILIEYDRVPEKYRLKDAYFSSDLPEVCIIEDFYKNRPIRVYENYSPALRATRYGLKVKQGCRFRKLTPLEGFYLQGFDEEDFLKVENRISDTQLWKQIGNSIDVKVLDYIFSFIDFSKI